MDDALVFLASDTHIAPLIAKYDTPALSKDMGYFQSLVRSIIYQQVTGKAAATIMLRFVELFPAKKFPSPKQVSAKTIEELRSAGLSGQKATYIKDLAEKLVSKTIREKDIPSMTTEEVTAHLTIVKGIGVWTVHMFMIFTLGRLDVLPVGDLGVRKGFQVVYKMKELPTPAQMEQRARPWRQYASVVSWYMWRVADEAKIKSKNIPQSK